MTSFPCSQCGQQLNVGEEYVGKTCMCPACGMVYAVAAGKAADAPVEAITTARSVPPASSLPRDNTGIVAPGQRLNEDPREREAEEKSAAAWERYVESLVSELNIWDARYAKGMWDLARLLILIGTLKAVFGAAQRSGQLAGAPPPPGFLSSVALVFGCISIGIGCAAIFQWRWANHITILVSVTSFIATYYYFEFLPCISIFVDSFLLLVSVANLRDLHRIRHLEGEYAALQEDPAAEP